MSASKAITDPCTGIKTQLSLDGDITISIHRDMVLLVRNQLAVPVWGEGFVSLSAKVIEDQLERLLLELLADKRRVGSVGQLALVNTERCE
jgi:hypothetical protein